MASLQTREVLKSNSELIKSTKSFSNLGGRRKTARLSIGAVNIWTIDKVLQRFSKHTILLESTFEVGSRLAPALFKYGGFEAKLKSLRIKRNK